MLHHPVVQRPVILKLQGAQGVGDALQSVLNGVGEVVHGVDAPLVPLTVVVHVTDPVDHRVTHVEVAGGQVDFRPKGVPVILKFARAHPGEQVKALFNRPIPVGGDGGGVQIAPVRLELLGGQIAHIGQTLLDQLHCVLVVLLEVVGAEEEPVAPVEAQPVNILLNGLYELHVLLGGVGVVHAQIAQAVVFFRGAEVDAQSLAVADVQVAVWLRREPGVDGHPGKPAARGNILIDERVDKILAFCHFCHIRTSSLLLVL